MIDSDSTEELISSEDFLSIVEETNELIKDGKINSEDLVIGSLDVENLYGSINVNKASEVVRERALRTNLKVENMDWRWALIYLALTLTPHEIVDQKLQQVVPKRMKQKNGRKAPGKPPTILTVEVDSMKERWHYPTPPSFLTPEQKTKILAAILGKMVQITFSYHYYEFDGKIYHQEGGCPTGLRPVGPISRILLD